MRNLFLAFLLAFVMDPSAQAAAPQQGRALTADEYLARAGFVVDKAFSEKERHELARGLAFVPVCLQQKARGLRIQRATGVVFYGQRIYGSERITINPKYYTPNPKLPEDDHVEEKNGAFVHELFHVIGEWNDEYYYKAYLALDPEGACPVSAYGEKMDVVEEDFAEAARLLFVPGTRGDRFQDECVDRKLAALKKIFDACK